MKILVLGATGGTGKHLVTQALAAGHTVTAIVRDPSKLPAQPNLAVVKGSVTSTADLESAIRGQDAVLGTLGPRAKADPICAESAVAVVAAMKNAGVKRLIWLSASGVGDSAGPITRASWVFGRIIMPLFLAKPYANHLRAEETLRASGLEWTVLRPVQLVDKQTGSPALATPIGSKPEGLKISRADVATFMLAELKTGTQVGKMPIVHA